MKVKSLFFALILTILTISSCSEENNSNVSDTGRLTVQLTDAPFPFDLVAEANVTVFKVDARLVDSGEDMEGEEPADEDSEESGFVTLMEEEVPVNLLDLTNGTTEQLADVEVPIGSYDLIRVFVRGVNVVLTDGRTFDLKVPSGEQTGIKVFISPALTVVGEISSDLLLDFDVSRSFVVRGNTKNLDGINGFNFKPVIKVSNLTTSGTLGGTVTGLEEEVATPLENAQISILDLNEEPFTSGATDSDGNYEIMGLDAGAYKVFASLNGFVNSDTLNIEIVAGNKTIQDFVLEAETGEEGN